MAENFLDDPQVDAGFQQMGGVTMTQRVHVSGLAHPALEQRRAKGLLQSGACDRPAAVLDAVSQAVTGDGGEQPLG
jgi:hypothetical protein